MITLDGIADINNFKSPVLLKRLGNLTNDTSDLSELYKKIQKFWKEINYPVHMFHLDSVDYFIMSGSNFLHFLKTNNNYFNQRIEIVSEQEKRYINTLLEKRKNVSSEIVEHNCSQMESALNSPQNDYSSLSISQIGESWILLTEYKNENEGIYYMSLPINNCPFCGDLLNKCHINNN